MGLNVLLIPPFGTVGAALATVSGYAVYNVAEVVVIHRTVGALPFSVETYKPLFFSGFVAVSLRGWFWGEQIGVSTLLGVWTAIVASHFASVYLLGSLDELDRSLISDALTKLDFSSI
uniref:polysaccharide biosynthesis C-terminal domain-containing protein n=1 Tax=Halorubrum californiense TaxID=416585 RepID=UPI00373AE2E1